MFEKSVEELTELGAQITTAEIAQQPELWRDTLNIYRENKEAIEAFLAEARAMGEGRLSVVFTGAGTSDYVGDTCAPYLRHAGNTDLYDFKPIATTDIVSAPRDFLRAEDPTLVVSFARSGNSPESLAAVAVAKELVHNVKFLNITCAPEGKLAVESADDPNALTLLIPRANDKGFAMTGSYTCMTLLSTLIFDEASDEQKAEWVETIAKMGEEVIARESSRLMAWMIIVSTLSALNFSLYLPLTPPLIRYLPRLCERPRIIACMSLFEIESMRLVIWLRMPRISSLMLLLFTHLMSRASLISSPVPSLVVFNGFLFSVGTIGSPEAAAISRMASVSDRRP